MKKIKSLIIAIMFLVSLVAVINPVSAADWHVYPGDSIQTAITNASGDDTIYVHAGTYSEWNIDIGKDLTIIGAGSRLTIIDGTNHDTVITVQTGVTVSISGMTITNGNSDGIRGGGIYNDGTLTLTDCTMSNNTAIIFGGGIYNHGSGALNIYSSTISGNTTTNAGSAGGGIYNNGTVSMWNSTVSGNTSDYGGGIYNNTSITLSQCTVSSNTATYDGGGIWNGSTNSDLKSTIVADNTAPNGPDFDNALNSYGYNLIEDTTDCTIIEVANPGTNITGVDPTLGPLANNGGPTQTHALLSGGPAIDTGDCTDINGNPVTTDQRGVSRPQGPGCDIGAYEVPQVTLTINPIAAFLPVKNYHLRQVNAYLECITENLPEDVPEDVQVLLDEMQEHINNANTTGNSIYANNELLKALKCAEDIQEKLGITCPL